VLLKGFGKKESINLRQEWAWLEPNFEPSFWKQPTVWNRVQEQAWIAQGLDKDGNPKTVTVQ